MPKDYRKGHFMIRKNEIRMEKEEVQPPKKKYKYFAILEMLIKILKKNIIHKKRKICIKNELILVL